MIAFSLSLVSALVLGCSEQPVIATTELGQAPVLQVTADWIEPDWMGSHRRIGDAYLDEIIACVLEELRHTSEVTGLDLNLGPIRTPGMWSFGIGMIPSPHGTPPEVFEIAQEVQDICRDRFPSPDFGGNDATPLLYQRMLDTRNCLVAHGFELPEPPNEESWIQLGGNWNPFQRLSATVRNDDELFKVALSACPQSGPVWTAGPVTQSDIILP